MLRVKMRQTMPPGVRASSRARCVDPRLDEEPTFAFGVPRRRAKRNAYHEWNPFFEHKEFAYRSWHSFLHLLT
jgi:hypothetical protein